MSDDLIWNAGEYTGIKADPDSMTSRMQIERVKARAMHADDIERLRVNRDPCFKCGVRMDKHGRKCGEDHSAMAGQKAVTERADALARKGRP